VAKLVALDSNVLILLVVGLTSTRYIDRHGALKEYDISDFHLLINLISVSAGIVVTPNALSEAANFLDRIKEPAKTEVAHTFQDLIRKTTEIYVKSTEASSRSEFVRLGLPDCALLEVSKQSISIVSADLHLCLAAQSAGYEAINFNHLRDRGT
jgi:hypothetical protein